MLFDDKHLKDPWNKININSIILEHYFTFNWKCNRLSCYDRELVMKLRERAHGSRFVLLA